MKAKKTRILVLILAVLMLTAVLSACAGQSTLPDGTYKYNIGQTINRSPFDLGSSIFDTIMPLGVEFHVKGSVITFELSDDVSFILEHKIKGKEIILTEENGNETALSFKKKNSTMYVINGTEYNRDK